MAKKVTPGTGASTAALQTPGVPPAAAKAAPAVPSRPAPAAPAPATQPLMVTDQMIADRAYFKWQNGDPGDHHGHWTDAERELRDNG